MSEQEPRFEALTAKVPTIGELEPGTEYRKDGVRYIVGTRAGGGRSEGYMPLDGERRGCSCAFDWPGAHQRDDRPDAILTNPDGTPYAGNVNPDTLPSSVYLTRDTSGCYAIVWVVSGFVHAFDSALTGLAPHVYATNDRAPFADWLRQSGSKITDVLRRS